MVPRPLRITAFAVACGVIGWLSLAPTTTIPGLFTLWDKIEHAVAYLGLALIGAVVAEFVAGTGGNSTGLAYQILYAGYQLNIPRMFAALLLISLTGVALFVLMAWLSRAALGSWHASELSRD